MIVFPEKQILRVSFTLFWSISCSNPLAIRKQKVKVVSQYWERYLILKPDNFRVLIFSMLNMNINSFTLASNEEVIYMLTIVSYSVLSADSEKNTCFSSSGSNSVDIQVVAYTDFCKGAGQYSSGCHPCSTIL